MKYAESTSVPVVRTRIEIETMLQKAGATRTGVILEPGMAVVGFSMGQWHVRFRMPLPREDEKRFTQVKGNRYYSVPRNAAAAKKLWEQACRSCWRSLLLTIKAKLVSVESKVETFEEAFLAHLVLPGGETVGQRALPALSEAYRSGTTPPLLGPGGGA